jgi:hypothetical protein
MIGHQCHIRTKTLDFDVMKDGLDAYYCSCARTASLQLQCQHHISSRTLSSGNTSLLVGSRYVIKEDISILRIFV